ncbi:bifunctional nicotinamidase/pyrazinamidase [Botryobacter ruber]|uniref:bifunctional nicotinamidase/pyrazinamidase n=1 Tax=Botryobacter ruber TaxID=2171629 RepID=UPI000E0B4ACA|nr:bifunctional nicotinamidase/pyrazinamidase [Botryobacter ruber]
MEALLLIDIQNDFLPGGSLEVPEGDKIIEVVNRLQERFELVVATQDWHPKNHKSFASNHPGKKVYDVIELHGLEQILWPDHCVQDTPGADFPPELHTAKIEAIFRKGMDPEIDTYSGFFDNGHLKTTGLADYLRGKNVQQVYLTGLAGDICVYLSGIDSLQEGFDTYFIEDATRPLNQEEYQRVMKIYREKGGKVIQSSELL